MANNVNSSTNANANKDSFKNTPHVNAKADTKADANVSGGAMDKISDVRSTIADKAAPAMDYLKNNFSTVRDSSQVYIDDAEALIKRHPFYTVLGAAAIGAVVGMFMSRSASSVRANV